MLFPEALIASLLFVMDLSGLGGWREYDVDVDP